MVSEGRGRLSLVPPSLHDDPYSDGSGRHDGLAPLLEAIFQDPVTNLLDEVVEIPRHPRFLHQMPFAVRQTLRQVLNAAADTALRAQMLEWSMENEPAEAQVLRRVRSLQEVAADLRGVAASLVREWDDDEGSP